MNYDQARWTAEQPATTDDRNGTNDAVYEPLLIEKNCTRVDPSESSPLPDDLTRDGLELPALSEPELARHFTRLSQMNYGVESGPFPLGSCTMKYNPTFTEDIAADPNAAVHPNRSEESIQGTLAVFHRLQELLARIGGMDAVTLQPPAGATGKFTGIQIAAAYHETNNDPRSEVIVPSNAHGTTFASAAMADYDVVELPAGDDGRVDMNGLDAALSDETAILMLTNPNTLGLFERNIQTIADRVHDAGALLYYDGTNLNALLGRARARDMGFDLMHFDLHKTFATPHGGGGPGAGPVGVTNQLAPFLPRPHVRKTTDGHYEFYEPNHSIGKIHGFHGHWPVLIKACAYIMRLGESGLRDTSGKAVLNANYLAEQLDLEIPYGPFYHEFVATAGNHDATDVAKRLLDYGVHSPTTKWPELVSEAMLIEPTEVESKRTLDQLAAAFNAVVDEDASTLVDAPQHTSARRIDQATAALTPRLSWHALQERATEDAGETSTVTTD